MKICAVILARGGSKRILRKNIVPVAGRPLIAHSVILARESPSVDRVIVSTDDDEIAAVAAACGADVIRRPIELSLDSASSEAAISHVLDDLRDRESYVPDLVLFLQPTSPLRASDDLERAIKTLVDEDADSLFSAREVEGFVWKWSAGSVSPIDYDPTRRPMRQAIPTKTLEENGSIYVFKPEILSRFGSRLGGRIAVLRMDPLHSFQIDEPSDLPLMEQLFRMQSKPVAPAALELVRLLVFDFDGVFTDNRVLVTEQGIEGVWCNRSDGLGIGMLRNTGLKMFVLSTESNPVVAARCRKVKLDYIQGCDNKLEALQRYAQAERIDAAEIAYVGNDWNDLACMQWVGLPIAVNDAVDEIKAVSRMITEKRGGYGAVHEIAGWFLAALQVKSLTAANT